jgi:hypothetical protein
MPAVFERGLENYGSGGSPRPFPKLQAHVEARSGRLSWRSWEGENAALSRPVAIGPLAFFPASKGGRRADAADPGGVTTLRRQTPCPTAMRNRAVGRYPPPLASHVLPNRRCRPDIVSQGSAAPRLGSEERSIGEPERGYRRGRIALVLINSCNYNYSGGLPLRHENKYLIRQSNVAYGGPSSRRLAKAEPADGRRNRAAGLR